jgi:hypothetical protein
MIDDPRIAEIAQAIKEIEALGPDVAWTLGIVTSETHVYAPPGRGVGVRIHAPGTKDHPDPIIVFEKGETFAATSKRAIERFKSRQEGECRA